MLTKLIKQELTHYRALPHKARLLISSYNFRCVAQPILAVFINAFIWRTTTSIFLVLIYNLSYFLTLPIAFLINGKLLKKLNVTQTHFIGLMFSILGVVLVILSKNSSIISLLMFGVIYGLGNGIYWSSKNYLDFQETNSKARTYYFSISSVIGSTINILVTFSIGWIIAYSEISRLYSPFIAYVGVTIIATICLFIAGFILLKSKFETPKISTIWSPPVSKNWNIVRLMNVCVGLYENTVSLVCTLLILNFLGKEGTLGTIVAIVTLFTLFLQYLFGRLSKNNHHKNVLFFILLISVILASILAISKSNLTVYFYVLLAGLPSSFYWLIFKPWEFNIIDKELSKNQCEKYPLFVDIEMFLNIGRTTGIMIFLGLLYFLPSQSALRNIPLVLVILQILLFSLIWKKLSWKKDE